MSLKVIVQLLAFMRFEDGFLRKRSWTIFFRLFWISYETSGLNHRVSISNAFRYPSRIFASDFPGPLRMASTSFRLCSGGNWPLALTLFMISSNSSRL